MQKHNFPNVYEQGRNLFTKSAFPGTKHFEERIFKKDGKEFRQWDPNRSKLAAAIVKRIKEIGFQPNQVVLYLGSGHGYTPSFVSDIIGKNGMMFCLDSSPRVVQDLIFICEARSNMAPILGDANKPGSYKKLIPDKVDIIFQDVAQKNQVEIFMKNVSMYLKKNGFALLALKARSVDVTKKPKDIFRETLEKLKAKLLVIDYKELAPFEKDHAFFLCKKR